MGTALLVFMASSVGSLPPYEGHSSDPNPYRLVYTAVIVYSIICFIGPISGAHLNPAVTFMAYLETKKRKGQLSVILAYLGA